MTTSDNLQDLNPVLDRIADLIVASERVVVFTGAGVSTESGIPDFRSPGGICAVKQNSQRLAQRRMPSKAGVSKSSPSSAP